jgi:hypothetical protein
VSGTVLSETYRGILSVASFIQKKGYFPANNKGVAGMPSKYDTALGILVESVRKEKNLFERIFFPKRLYRQFIGCLIFIADKEWQLEFYDEYGDFNKVSDLTKMLAGEFHVTINTRVVAMENKWESY